MDELTTIFGKGEQLSAWQMSARAGLIFFITLLLFRIGGGRIYGKKSAFDIVIMISMGAVLGRAIVGATPLTAAIAASCTMILIHRLLAWLCIKSRTIEILLKGKARKIFEKQKILYRNLEKESLSQEDFFTSLRLETRQSKLEDIESATMETNGRISFLLKEKNSQ